MSPDDLKEYITEYYPCYAQLGLYNWDAILAYRQRLVAEYEATRASGVSL